MQSGRNTAKPVAGNARRKRAGPRLLAQHLRDLADQLVTDVHAEVVVDDVHAIHVHVQHAFGHRAAARGELRAHLGLECRAGEERGERIVVGLQDRRRLARQELGEPLGARVEVRRVLGAEHHEEAEHAA